ncbi:MAG: hypothetical protein ACRCYV_07255 [Aeromonas sp.]
MLGGVTNPLNLELSSLWDGLSPHLLARIFEVDDAGNALSGQPVVRAPFGEDVQLEADFNWQSPFENAGAEGAAPALMSLLQSGALGKEVEQLGALAGVDVSGASGVAQQAQGRSGMTKLNSTQIFNGAPPMRIQGELILRAWLDPAREVESPFDQLMQWALPKQLAVTGTLLTNAATVAATDKGTIDGMLPSQIPSLLGLTYKGRTYSPVVIERIGVPLGSAVDYGGRFVQLKLPITFATLTAIDKNDWLNMKGVRL